MAEFLLCRSVLAMSLPTTARAALILDTGVPGGTSLQSSTTRAAQFTIGATTTIDSISHWLRVLAAGTATFAIYNDAAGLPGTQLYSQAATLAVTPTGSAEWRGVDGLSWVLSAGTYWVSYEVRPGQTVVARRPLPTVPEDFPPNPAALEASKFSSDPAPISEPWLDAGSRTGWRVSGSVATTVPEPGTLGLLLSTLAGVALARRRWPGSAAS